MSKPIEIFWTLNNYCTGGCTYCPSMFWGGEKPDSIENYLLVANKIITHYTNLGIKINWHFDGGEPLEFFDFPELLKKCKTENTTIHLRTSGGKMWLNWWAVEPYIDRLELTYHYWQNPNLINFIVQIFQSKNKDFQITVPIRPDFFDDDCQRATSVEQQFSIKVAKSPLYKSADTFAGLFPYTKDQQEILFGKEWVEQNFREVPLEFKEKHELAISSNPSFTGKLCNAGLEYLHITHDGWLKGSHCNNSPYGNIFQEYELPQTPQVCKMISCVSPSDQQITKFLS